MATKSIFRNTLYKLFLSTFNIIVPVLVGPYINALLDKSEYGVYNKALSIVTFFLIFASFGIYNLGVREISKVREDKKKLSSMFTNLFVFGIITNLVVSLIYILYALFVVESGNQIIFIVMVIQILFNTFMVEWVNEAVENFGFITKKTVIIRIISTVLLFLVVTRPEHTFIYALLTSVTIAVNNFVGFLYVKRKIQFDFSDIKLTRYLKPLTLQLIIANVSILFTLFDRLMLGWFVSNDAVTEYTLPCNLVNMVALTMMLLITVSIPRLNYYISQGMKKEYLSLLNQSTRGYFLLIFPSCIGLFCLGYEVTMLYASEKWIAAAPVMQMFALRFIFTSIVTIYSNQVLFIFKKEKRLVQMLAIGGAINVIFKFILLFAGYLTPTLAIAATGLAEIIMLMIMRWYIKYRLKLEYDVLQMKNFKYLLLSLPFILIVYAVKLLGFGVIITSAISVAICCAYYFGILLLTKDQMLKYFAGKLLGRFRKRS